jgi:hypothetical protein
MSDKLSNHQKKMSKYYSSEKSFNYKFHDEESDEFEGYELASETRVLKIIGYCWECCNAVCDSDFESKRIWVCSRCSNRDTKGKLMEKSEVENRKAEIERQKEEELENYFYDGEEESEVGIEEDLDKLSDVSELSDNLSIKHIKSNIEIDDEENKFED